MNNDHSDEVGKGIDGREKLAELYPTPKTYDELESNRLRIEAIKKGREEKFPELRVLAEMGGIVGLAMVSANSVPEIVAVSSLSGVSFGFLSGLICFGLAWAHFRRTQYVFQKMQIAYMPFLATYIASVTLLTAVILDVFKNESSANTRMLVIVSTVFVVQAVVGYMTILLMKSKKAPVALKVLGLGAIIIACAVVSFVVL